VGGGRQTIKVTAFDLNAQDTRCGDPGSWSEGESQFVFRFN